VVDFLTLIVSKMMPEIIPFEPDQGNACAGKQKPFYFL
jgi:hypothetical protein